MLSIAHRDMFLEAEDKINKLESEKHDLQLRIKKIDKNIDKYKNIVNETKDVICIFCHGLGSIREWYAQDDSKIVSCNICKGTGLKQ